MKKQEFIDKYIAWLKDTLERILPDEATDRRFMEIARRQCCKSLEFLLNKIRGGSHGQDSRVTSRTNKT